MFFKLKRSKLDKVQEECINNLLKVSNDIIDDTVRRLFQIKDIDEINETEIEKKRHRNVLINNQIDKLLKQAEIIKKAKKELVTDYQSKN